METVSVALDKEDAASLRRSITKQMRSWQLRNWVLYQGLTGRYVCEFCDNHVAPPRGVIAHQDTCLGLRCLKALDEALK